MVYTVLLAKVCFLFIFLGWMVELGSLYLSIKAREKEDRSKCKFFYRFIGIGETSSRIGLILLLTLPFITILELII